MRLLKNKKGFTFMELIIAMVVFAILGTTVVTLLKTGLKSSTKINNDMNYETQARTAMSLVTVQIRQHDETGGISLLDAATMLFIDDPDAAKNEAEGSTGTLVYYSDGELYSKILKNIIMGESGYIPPAGGDEYLIASVNSLDISEDVSPANGSHVYIIDIGYGEGRTLSQTVTQRSDPEAAAPTGGASAGG